MRLVLLATVALCALLVASAARAEAAPPPPTQDPFYHYFGTRPLRFIAPGTVLGSRQTTYQVSGVTQPVTVVQLLYRSTTVLGRPTTNVTSVLLPPTPSASPQLVAYNSFYDSLSPNDDPSYLIESGQSLGEEAGLIAPLLNAGDTVDFADTEGSLQPDFSVGPAYGFYTLDAMKAALWSPATHLSRWTKMALMGYSGGAIATGWAAQMAATYAPTIERRLVGATMGGVEVDPAHNLLYVNGSTGWGGVTPMSLDGLIRAYHIRVGRYLSSYGAQVLFSLRQAAIGTALSEYSGFKFQQLTKPQFASPFSIPPLVRISNMLILGHDALPQIPLQIAQGANGVLDGSNPNVPGVGPGDGVMVAGDAVDYTEYDSLDHTGAAVPWLESAYPWLAARFADQAAPNDCSTIAPGNSLAPVTLAPAG